MAETVAEIVAAHRAGSMTPAQTVARSFARIRDHNDPAIFISLRDEKSALAEAEALSAKDPATLSLYGIPVGVKDNIDALGMPTTAACPAFSYTPNHDSTAVTRRSSSHCALRPRRSQKPRRSLRKIPRRCRSTACRSA